MKNIHLLPTDKPSRLIQAEDDELMLLNELYENTYNINKHIYITSDEEIKEGDVVKIPCGVGKVKNLHWKFGNDNPSYIVEDIFIYKLRYGQKEGELQINSFRYEDVKKIILTTDQDLIKDGVQEIDDEFLKWFSKNPSCDEIEVNWVKTPDGIFYHKDNIPYGCYKIIIPKEEPKQETLEEAAEKYSENWEEITGLDYENTVPSEVNKLDFINGAKWQQEQNKNLYTEEEVRKMFSRYNEVIAHRDIEEWQPWIDKQFKKK